MLCILPVHQGDVSRLANLIRWIEELGGCPEHDAAIVADADTETGSVFTLRAAAARCFKSVSITTTEKGVKGWPEGPNELFLAAAQYAKARNTHWLFLEPDCVPLCPRWLDKIDIHYRASNAVYMGRLVPCEMPGMPRRHFTGVGVYPAKAYDEVADLVRRDMSKAFDLVTAEVLVPQAIESELFQHLWGETGNPPTFAAKGIPGTGTFGLDYLHNKAVLFHRTKDGTLIELLRRRIGAALLPQVHKPFIQLGRFGDIILLLPSLRYIAETTGIVPKLIVSQDYASVLEGVSYVQPIPLPVHWYMGMPQARHYAQTHFGGGTVLQCHGHEWGINLAQWPSFMVSMIDRTGVPLDLFHSLPLIFDCRNRAREASAVPKTNGKPYLLINTVGVSSPFPHGQKIFSALRHLASHVALIDMNRIRCHRIYDLLGVMDQAVGMITTDTATLHLAHGSPRPYVALTVDGWCSSVPRGNCHLEIKYSRFLGSLGELVRIVESWI